MNNILADQTIVSNPYQLVRQIGRGGMGAVYETIDLRLQTTVALKQRMTIDDVYRHAFEREARILARLRHPGLPVVSDYFSDQHGTFLVMDFVPGNDLAAIVAQRGALDELEALQIANQLLEILAYLHGQQPPVLHRAIKPGDIRLQSDGHVVLLDFGLASDEPQSAPTAMLGQSTLNPYSRSLWYAPPS